MTDYIWPSSVIPGRSTLQLRDLSSRFASPFTGTTRTYSRPGGDLLSLTLDLPVLTGLDKAALTGLIAKLRGGVHRIWCKDHSYVQRGSFPTGELLSNNTFASGTTGWSGNYSTRSVQDRVLRIVAASHTATQYPQLSQSATLVSGSAYVVRGHFQNMSNAALTFGIYFDYGSTAVTGYSTVQGMRVVSAIADQSGASSCLWLYDDDTATGDTIDIAYTSVSRCAFIAGASQTGVRILVDQLPISTDGLLLEGDQVQIGSELFHVAAALNSDATGAGYLTLHRPPRAAPADNAPVIIHEPMGLFMLAESNNGWDNQPGRLATSSVSLIEAVT